MITIAISLELKRRQREREIMAIREETHRIYMSQIFKAQEDERRRIARELHDDTTQTLLAVANRANLLASGEYGEIDPEEQGHVEWIRDTVLSVSNNVRSLSHDLRPGVLDNIGLIPALRMITERINREDKIYARITVKGAKRKLSPETEALIFRIVQEGLNNVKRHSKATKVMVSITFTPESIRIIVKDNGEGFDVQHTMRNLTADGKLGLIGIQERARILNGDLDIQSSPGKGTSLLINVKC